MRRRDFLSTTAASAALRLSPLKAFNSAQHRAPAWREPKSDAELFLQEDLTPSGPYYKAIVPDTLDLAERGHLSVRGFMNCLDPGRSYEPYQLAFFDSNPPYMSHYGALGNNWGKVAEGIFMGRHMSGSTEGLREQTTMLKGILSLIGTNGEFAVDDSHSVWASSIRNEDIRPMDTTRVYMSLMVHNQLRPSARLMRLIARMADSVCDRAKIRDDCAYLTEVASEAAGSEIGVSGNSQTMLIHGTALHGLSRVYDLTGEAKYLELSTKLKNLALKPEYWVPESASKATVAGGHAHIEGHLHSCTTALMGLLWYAGVTNDARVKEFVRGRYEYVRNCGIARIGLFGETCIAADMTWLAIKLSDMGVGDYWEDADQYVRNQLSEQQVTSAATMKSVVASMPARAEMKDPEYARLGATTDHVIERSVGAYLAGASNPTLIGLDNLRWTACCWGDCPPALYAAWEAIARYDAGVAQINLLLNRASPWLDVNSYLPHEGKVMIRNKAAQRVLIRIPRWVEKEKVFAQVNDRLWGAFWFGRYLCLERLRAGDEVRIEFPMVESKETYTLPHEPPDRFTFTLRGNTVVDINPRTKAPGYPLYEREADKRVTAPMHEVMRYVSPVLVKY